jgi:NAD(P)-dependent dehydrogenase (short-subunit alcohol dehydrogenase family)
MKDTVPLFSMRGRTVLVTGATGYLGRAMSLALADAGARVLVNGRSPTRVSALVDEVLSSGGEAEEFAFDVTDPGQVRSAISRVEGPLHALINNAYVGGGGTLRTADSQAYRDSFEVGVVAAHRLLQESLPALRRAVGSEGDASVINVASMYGLVSPDPRIYDSPAASNPPFYGAAKGALLQWTRYAACELGAEGIRVNSVSPGAFPSDAVRQSSPDFVSRLAARVPLRRTGRSPEIAGPVLFLASAASSYVNGTNLIVDGGWTSW